MFTSVEKTKSTSAVLQRKQLGQTFFRKAGEENIFDARPSSSFFSAPVQAKLNVSSPDDPQEKEADAVADQVMRMSEPVAAAPAEKEEEKLQRKEDDREEEVQPKLIAPVISINRKCEKCEKEEKESPEVQRKIQRVEDSGIEEEKEIDRKAITSANTLMRSQRGPPASQSYSQFEHGLSSSKGSGSAMSPDTQNFMESRFNADFSGVRIHTGSYAENLSSSINAQAFTHGNDIYFNSGKYSPQTETGGTLLAHELTHTIQQGASAKAISKKSAYATKPISLAEGTAVQRKSAAELTEQIDLSARSGGSQLNNEAKEYLQDYYNTNLNDVRVHTDSQIASFCSTSGIKAFVQGRDIAISPGYFNMESEAGAVLLSQQVSKSLDQRGIKPVAKDGGSVGGINELLNNIKNAVKNSAEPRTEKNTDIGLENPKTPAKAKKQGSDRTKNKSKKKKSSTGSKSKKDLKSSDGLMIGLVKTQKGRSPKVPAEDPAFLKVVSKTKQIAKGQKQHEPAEKKADDAKKNAGPVPKEAEGKAQNRKSDAMGVASEKDIPFNAEHFKADLLKKIEEITPKNLEQASEFKENNRIAEVKSTVNNQVEKGKQDTTGPVSGAVEKPLDVNPADNKQSAPLPPTSPGVKPFGPGANAAVPKNKTAGEISMQEQSASLDEEMKANNVTEQQLKSSNEPSFEQALNEKNNAQKDAIEKPDQYRKEEAVELNLAKTEATGEASKALTAMHNSRSKNFNATVLQQQSAKSRDEDARAKVTLEIERLYKVSEETVNKSLEEAETQSNEEFDKGAEKAGQEFENYVDRKMREYKARRYSGFWGGLKWAKDKLFGMPDEVNVFYRDGRALYINKMDAVITKVANIVADKLNAAKTAIRNGKKAIDDFVAQLPKDQQSIGKEAADTIKDRFDALEQNVNDKRDGLIEGLAKKYVDNVSSLDEKIETLKEANKGLVDKAIGALKAVWKVIKDLTNLFTTILARLASIIGLILNDPGKFFDNIGRAFKLGLDQFKANFIGYLEKGLMDWLATNLGLKGIELPEKFDLKAVIVLSLQVMGITKEHIRERAVAILGEKKVKMIETAGGVLHRVATEGVGAIWEMILEKINDFKEQVWEAIKSFIQTKIIQAAITFVLSLLTPVGAFVKVCMAIYDFLMALVRFKDRIVELLDTVLNAVVNIASGAVEGAANAIEKAFAKSIPVVIAFLAALLRLNDIAAKVRAIIIRMRARVDKAIDFVIRKAEALAKKVVKKGKEVAIAAGKKILNWLGLRKDFKTPDGESHSLYLSGTEENPVLMVASDPEAIKSFLNSFLKQKDLKEEKRNSAKSALSYVEGNIDPVLKSLKTEKEESKKISLSQTLLAFFNSLAEKISKLLGTAPLNEIMEEEKYNLEGLTGTYGTMPKPKADKFTADHQPQAAIFKYSAGLSFFKGTKMEQRAGGQHADAAYAINLQHRRHVAGRTYGSKGSGTISAFREQVQKISKEKVSDNKKREKVILKIRAELNDDVSAIKTIVQKDNYFTDIDELGMKGNQKKSLIGSIRKQIISGENLIASQNLDELAEKR